MLAALALALGVGLIASPVAAAGPVRSDFTKIYTDVLIGVCQFDVTIHGNFSGTEIDFFDNNGHLTRADYHLVGQDTFAANGKTIVGLPYRANFQFYFESGGNLTHFLANGQYEKFVLPDGKLSVAAGHGDIEGYGLSPLRGNQGNVAGLCAALAP
ncbi:MAG: hypothetical protein ABI847_17575 [Anaerolineales bacterium]